MLQKLSRLCAVLGLLATSAPAAPAAVNRFRCPLGKDRFCEQGIGEGAAPTPFFQFAPASGVGLPVASTLCTALSASDQVGNWWCFNGADASMKASSAQTLSAVGSPITQAVRVCPNGPDCASVTGRQFNVSGAYYQSGATALTSADDFTICALVRSDDHTYNASGGSHDIFSKYSNVALKSSFRLMTTNTGANISFEVYKSNASKSTATSSGSAVGNKIDEGAHHLVCAVYDFVSDGASLLTMYIDGTATNGGNTTGVGPMQANATTHFIVGANDLELTFPDTFQWKGLYRGALYTEKAMTSGAIATLARAVLADTPTGSLAEPITFARNALSTCAYSDADMTVMPINRPCVRPDLGGFGGMQVNRAATNLALRSEEFDNGVWTLGSAVVAAPARTANSTDVTDPKGGYRSEKLVIPSVQNATEASYIYQSITPAAGATSMSVYLRTASGSTTVYLFANDVTYLGTKLCTVTTTWSRCNTDNFAATGGAGNYFIGFDLRAGSGQVAQGVGTTIYAYGAQVQSNAYTTNYIPTAGSTVLSVADRAFATIAASPIVRSESATSTIYGFAPAAGNRPMGSVWIDASNDTEHYLAQTTTAGTGASINGWWTTGGSFTTVNSGDVASISKVATAFYASNFGGFKQSCVNATCSALTATALVPVAGATKLYIGAYGGLAGYETDGLLTKVCASAYQGAPGGCPQ